MTVRIAGRLVLLIPPEAGHARRRLEAALAPLQTACLAACAGERPRKALRRLFSFRSDFLGWLVPIALLRREWTIARQDTFCNKRVDMRYCLFYRGRVCFCHRANWNASFQTRHSIAGCAVGHHRLEDFGGDLQFVTAPNH